MTNDRTARPDWDPQRPVGFESRKAFARRTQEGFWRKYVWGPDVVDIGYRGGMGSSVATILPCAKGIELGDAGYDGINLPYADSSQDAVHASHVLEHVTPPDAYLREWFRVLRPRGHMILFVPHAYLYERRLSVPPSRFSPEHLRSYTPASLLAEVERALEPNTYRVRHLADNDTAYDYSLPIETHPTGCLEIELVIQKIRPPSWKVEP